MWYHWNFVHKLELFWNDIYQLEDDPENPKGVREYLDSDHFKFNYKYPEQNVMTYHANFMASFDFSMVCVKLFEDYDSKTLELRSLRMGQNCDSIMGSSLYAALK